MIAMETAAILKTVPNVPLTTCPTVTVFIIDVAVVVIVFVVVACGLIDELGAGVEEDWGWRCCERW